METRTLTVPYRTDSAYTEKNDRIARLFGKKLFALKDLIDVIELANLVALAERQRIIPADFLQAIPYAFALESFEYDLKVYNLYDELDGEDREAVLHAAMNVTPAGWEPAQPIVFALPLDKFDVLLANEMPRGKDRRSRALYALAKEVCETFLREYPENSYAHKRVKEILHG